MKPIHVTFKVGKERCYGYIVAFRSVSVHGQPRIVAIVVSEGGEIVPMDLENLSVVKPEKL